MAKTAFIEPGSPWENGYVESFNARLRDELLDGEIFLFGSRTRSQIARQAELHRMRRVVRELIHVLPEDRKNSRRAKDLAAWGCGTTIHLVEINARPVEGETNSRDYDFSRAAIKARWEAGYTDTRRMIARQPWDDPIDPAMDLTVYKSDAPA